MPKTICPKCKNEISPKTTTCMYCEFNFKRWQLESMSRDNDKMKRCAAANDPDTPASVLKILSCDTDMFVRSSTAHNPSTPTCVLEKLSGDTNICVRTGVALNPRTPPCALEKLSKDDFSLVRSHIARNPRTPKRALEKMLGNGNVGEMKAMINDMMHNPRAPISAMHTAIESVRRKMGK